METLKAVLDRLEATTPTTTASNGQSIDTPERIANAKRYFKKLLDERVGGEFVIQPHHRQVISDVFFYACNRPHQTTLDTNKGLLLFGSVGTGKTTLLYAVRQFLLDTTNSSFKVYNVANEVVTHYSKCGDIDKFITDIDIATGKRTIINMAFDELGREPIPANHYGTKMNVMEQIIQARYSHFTTMRAKTHFTTNCTVEDLKTLYGGYIVDRLKEMCNWITFVGQSYRR